MTRRLEVSGWKTKECSIGKQLARRNIELEEIREIGRGLVVQWFRGKKKKFVLNVGFDRRPV